VAPLTADDLNTIRGHRNNVSGYLQMYRKMSGFTERRRGYPVGSAASRKLQLNVAENSAALAAWLPIGFRFGLAAAGGSGVGAIGVGVRTAVGAAGVEGGAVGVLSRVVVPLAAIAFFFAVDGCAYSFCRTNSPNASTRSSLLEGSRSLFAS
jgi:hypothetical protein